MIVTYFHHNIDKKNCSFLAKQEPFTPSHNVACTYLVDLDLMKKKRETFTMTDDVHQMPM
jgi:hypothetical protein